MLPSHALCAILRVSSSVSIFVSVSISMMLSSDSSASPSSTFSFFHGFFMGFRVHFFQGASGIFCSAGGGFSTGHAGGAVGTVSSTISGEENSGVTGSALMTADVA